MSVRISGIGKKNTSDYETILLNSTDNRKGEHFPLDRFGRYPPGKVPISQAGGEQKRIQRTIRLDHHCFEIQSVSRHPVKQRSGA